ncbi:MULTISPECIES: sensor histidine kinase [Spirosoma]|uniref:histidine kinase n=1 Tax=Spirosoma liriopis TaxID=2937440 RepID=A0ABT0HGJ3_9BACT|nr:MULTISPECIES: HAMP domain-containing sensor histidine kinase [Spirosoma]MCK8491276.1 HAMP domain-containing histidine kinase [Spirosoma liriopis]UHG90650.1 HAMP domain-containing histidine kinase [Spirosoma oryzicola]
MDFKVLERRFRAIEATEIGPKLVEAYIAETLAFLGADDCFILQERDEWTATVQFTGSSKINSASFNPAQLIDLTRETCFFLESDFTPRRALKALLGGYRQVAGFRLNNYSVKGWALIVWTEPNDLPAEDVEDVLYRFSDKILITSLSLQRIALEQQYRFIFGIVPQAIVLVNEEDETSWVNQAAIELLDLEQGDLRPSPASLSIGMLKLRNQALNLDAINHTAAEFIRDSNFSIKEWLWIFSDKILSILTRPIFSPYFKGRIWLFNDVTELYQKNQQLSEANREIENLISVIAHDLKSPLATLSFIFNFLPMHGPLNEEQNENIEYGQKTIKRGLNLIDSIVYFNKLISSNLPVQMEDVELDDLISVIVEGFSAQAYQKEITLHTRRVEQPVLLHTDPESLVRILDNLVSNALKFSPFGRNIYVETDMRDDQLTISVRDEGPGISDQDRTKLFKRFQRLSAQPTNNEGSSGLGLSIVKALTDKLGATIEVDSTVNVGTTFRLVFPITFVRVSDQITAQ